MNKMIVCTSTSCINYLGKPENVAILPINVHINDEDYIDGQTLTVNELSQRMLQDPNSIVRTSAPHEGQLLEFFYELVEQGINEILVITLSSKASLTYQNIQGIQSIFGEKLKIHLFDSRSISHSEALLTFEASKMLNEGRDIIDIMLRLNKMRNKMQLYITADNLKPMIQAKRISGIEGFIGTLLDIKPIIYVQDNGEVVGYEKVRGFEKSLNRLVELIDSHAKNKQGTIYTAYVSNNPHINLLNQILKQFGYHNVVHLPIASATIANIGPNSIGMMFVENLD